MLFGVYRSTALAAGVIMAAIPAVVALLSWLLLGERPGWRTALGIACAIAGIALVALARDDEGELASGSLLGSAAPARRGDVRGALRRHRQEALGARRPEADQRADQPLGPRAGHAARALAAARTSASRFIPPSSWVLLAVYSIAASMLTVWLWMTGVKHVPASSAGVFTVFLPISAATVGMLIYGEQFTIAQARRSRWRWSASSWRRCPGERAPAQPRWQAPPA